MTPPPPTPWVWYEDPAVFPEVLTPWKHFVPVDADFTDLVERVRAPLPAHTCQLLPHPALLCFLFGDS